MSNQGEESGETVIRSVLQVDSIENPEVPAKQIMNQVDKIELLRHYRIANFTTIE